MDNLCRTCMCPVGNQNAAVPLSSETEMGDTVAGLLSAHCSVEFARQDDRLPKEICTMCLDALFFVISFLRKCEQSEQNLQRLLEEQDTTAAVEAPSVVEDVNEPTKMASIEEGLIYKVELMDGQQLEEPSQSPVDEEQLQGEQETNDECLVQPYNVVEMMNFQCCVCSEVLYNEEDYREHLQSGHGVDISADLTQYAGQTSCHICRQIFETVEELDSHQGKRFMELYQCNSCEDNFESVEQVMQHVQLAHGDAVEEDSASSPKPSVDDNPAPKERYCCVTHCHDFFLDEQELIVHAHAKHELKLKYNQERMDAEKPFICNICFRSFGSMKNLRVHQFVRANHNQGRHFICEHCPFRAVSQSLLTIHERSKHSGERPFGCPQCQKRFFSELHLKNHLVCHSSARPFSCAFCEKSFSRKRNMDEHIRSCHSEEKPFACELCPARFKVPQHLRIHARIHSGEKPYKCSYCENSYYHISDRKRHEMTHTGVKPYKCDICKAAFTRKRTLKIHERTHSGERPFVCEICEKGFCQRTTLKKHMDRHEACPEDAIILTAEMLNSVDEVEEA